MCRSAPPCEDAHLGACVGRTTKSAQRGTKAATNILRLNTLYRVKTVSYYRRSYGLARNYLSLRRRQICFQHTFPQQSGSVSSPSKSFFGPRKVNCYMCGSPYLLSRRERYRALIISAVLPRDSRTFKFKSLHWQWGWRGMKNKYMNKKDNKNTEALWWVQATQ